MYYSFEKLTDFYKEIGLYDKYYFKEIEKRVKKLPNIKSYDFYGVFPKINKEGILIDFVISVPFIEDLNSFLVNIHEYAHGITMMQNLSKPFKNSIMDEVLPKSIERIYINKYESKETIKNYNEKDMITYEKTKSQSHKNAILMQFIVFKTYEELGTVKIPDYIELQEDIKEKLVKKLLINN